MSIRSDAYRDAGTGLLRRAAFRHELASYLDNAPAREKRGCLLVIRFPVLQRLARGYARETVDKALCDLLAMLETRLRGRDNMGRLTVHSLCVHLRRCAPSHARSVARDYLDLLESLDIEVDGKSFSVSPQLRIVLLDKADAGSLAGATVISHHAKVREAELTSLSALNPVGTDVIRQRHSSKFADVLTFDSRQEYWRVEPSRWLCSRNEDIHMVRLRSLSKHVCVSNAQYMLRILDALSLNPDHRLRTVPNRIAIPTELDSLSCDTVRWLVDQTRERRVSPADICFEFAADEASEQLRNSLPLLRRLRRTGFRLMLSRADNLRVLATLQRALKVDYVIVSAKRLQLSVSKDDVRDELATLVKSVHDEGGRVVVSGIDTEHLASHAQSLQLDLGFGRFCGRSLPFASLSDGS